MGTGNRAPYGQREESFSQLVDLTGETDDTTHRLFVLPFDVIQIDSFTVTHYVAGVGTQNIVYSLTTEAASPATVSATLTKANDGAVPQVGTTALGNGTSILQGTVIRLVANFAAAVTSGPALAVSVRVRR